MRIVRWFFTLVVLLAAGAAIAYYVAGTLDGPTITIHQPSIIGQASTLDVLVEAPGAELSGLTVQLEQKGRSFPLFDLLSAPGDAVVKEGDRTRLTRPVGKKVVPDLQSGPATVRVRASRRVLRGLRDISADASREVQVRLDPPSVSVISTHHYVNLGGSEMVVYRATPADVESGVRVGDLTYPGAPGAGAGLTDPALRVAFFALLYNQKPDTPMELYARDIAGNEARAQFEHRVFPKPFRQSRIPLDDKFLSRVVPAILQGSPLPGVSAGDLLPAFLRINNDLRRTNNETIAALARKTAPAMLWEGAFQPLGGSQVESSFADFRTYLYDGKEVDKQVHLGFDLAKTTNASVTAANHGKVLYAADLGIYGNCVILDHGLGLQSLYAHLSSFSVKEGDVVRKGQRVGGSGQTGLAGGDHLHFSMMLNGQFVNATEWWDPHWIEDRVMRKLRDAGLPGEAAPAAKANE
ncbi:MAG TPA: M23 family metallopeptidase [Vicinamibacterales bacterium]|nr:M23 family metallopeptidase [Vicinamibacterales bacterium]